MALNTQFFWKTFVQKNLDQWAEVDEIYKRILREPLEIWMPSIHLLRLNNHL